MLFCSDKKEQGSQVWPSPSGCPVLAKRRQISIGSSWKVRSPDPAQPSSLKEPRPRTQLDLRLLRHPNIGAGLAGYDPDGLPLLLGLRGQEGECFTAASRPGSSQWAASARALEPCRKQPPACSLGPQLTHQPRPGELEGPGEMARIGLLPHSPPDDHHSATIGWMTH